MNAREITRVLKAISADMEQRHIDYAKLAKISGYSMAELGGWLDSPRVDDISDYQIQDLVEALGYDSLEKLMTRHSPAPSPVVTTKKDITLEQIDRQVFAQCLEHYIQREGIGVSRYHVIADQIPLDECNGVENPIGVRAYILNRMLHPDSSKPNMLHGGQFAAIAAYCGFTLPLVKNEKQRSHARRKQTEPSASEELGL